MTSFTIISDAILTGRKAYAQTTLRQQRDNDLHLKDRLDGIDVFTASGTWTKREGAGWVLVFAWGAGGGGHNAAVPSGGGGGGGAFSWALFLASDLGATESVTVGAGGAAGSAGGNSSFGSLLTSPGGAAGTLGASGAGGKPWNNSLSLSLGSVGLLEFGAASTGVPNDGGYGGASGGYSGGSANVNGGASLFGGGGGARGSSGGTGGASSFGGPGGNWNDSVPAQAPGGGGGFQYNVGGYAGARGEVWVIQI